MRTSTSLWLVLVAVGALATTTGVSARSTDIGWLPADARPTYRVEPASGRQAAVRERFTPDQLELLEKLNRATRVHLERLPHLVVPDVWFDDERAYSPFPVEYAAAQPFSKVLIVHLGGQMFGAYERGALVRWGPVSSGARQSATPAGTFALTWRSLGHTSTVDPDWFMPWYFNFENREGLAFHEYTLPGRPASHGCIRLLRRDAQWLYAWGEPWVLDTGGVRILQTGTPVVIVAPYDYDAAPPWRSLSWLAQPVSLPESLGIIAWMP